MMRGYVALCLVHLKLHTADAHSAVHIGSFSGQGVAPEPWPALHGGSFSGPAQPLSPDPLVRFVWGPGINETILQTYLVPAVACGPASGTSSASFVNASSAVGSLTPRITVAGAGTLLIDFGVELAAWLEFDSLDLMPADVGDILLGISEYTAVDYVGGFKSGTPVVYGSSCGAALCTYRLETNSELYEGVRYGFITLSEAPSRPWTITGLRAVSQAKAVNYVSKCPSLACTLLRALEHAPRLHSYTPRFARTPLNRSGPFQARATLFWSASGIRPHTPCAQLYKQHIWGAF